MSERDTLSITLFRAPHGWARAGQRKQVTLGQLQRVTEKPALWPGEPTIDASRERLPGLSLAVLRDDNRVLLRDPELARAETEARVESISGLLVEYVDEPLVDPEHIERWWHGYAYVAWTTAFHQRPMGDRPPGPRWRVLVPFNRDATLEEARLAARWARHAHRGAGNVHVHTEHVARVVAMPAVVPGGHAHRIGDGTAIAVDQITHDLHRWAETDRLEAATRAMAGTTLADAVGVLLGRREAPGPGTTMGWTADAPTAPTQPTWGSVAALDRLGALAGPLWPGRLAVLIGVSGAGRSALALQLVDAVARAGHPVLFASAGLPRDEVVARLLVLQSAQGGPAVPASAAAILQGAGEDEALSAAVDALQDALPHLHLWAPDTAERTDEALRVRSSGVAGACGSRPPLVVVDPVEGFEDGHALSATYRQLSAACRDLSRPGTVDRFWPGAAVLAVVDAPEGLGEDLATASALREAADHPAGRARLRERIGVSLGGLATDAALVLGLARDPSTASSVGPACAAVLKNRHGHTGVVDLTFHGAAGLFTEVEASSDA